MHDDAVEDPEAIYARALEHIGATPGGFMPPKLRRVWYRVRLPASNPYADRKGNRRELTSRERVGIYEYFRHDVERLEEMMGRDLSAWRPPSRTLRGFLRRLVLP